MWGLDSPKTEVPSSLLPIVGQYPVDFDFARRPGEGFQEEVMAQDLGFRCLVEVAVSRSWGSRLSTQFFGVKVLG